MRFNAVLAAPGFEQWFEGEPLDPARLLYTSDGKPRVAVMSIAHLGDAERMFFVSLLLNQVLGWMRAQTGTTSLRAVIYMDEIAGYFPPVANPPSKGPLLTLLKQGRAFGLGVVLATQNPVDLDYKGLSNIGTWFLGRLQTERDKARVLDGLEGAAAGSFDRSEVDRLLSALQKRVFLLHNVHEEKLVTFQTRWTLSYLRGPLSRDQIRSLMAGRARLGGARSLWRRRDAQHQRGSAPATPDAASDRLPVLPPGIEQFFIPRQAAGSAKPVLYSPVILGAVRLGFSDSKLNIDLSRDVVYAASIGEGPVALDWAAARRLDIGVGALGRTPEKDASFESLPSAAAQAKNYAAWEKTLKQWLGQNERLQLLRHRETGLTSRPDESEGDFKVRVQDAARAARDAAVDAVRQKYAVSSGGARGACAAGGGGDGARVRAIVTAETAGRRVDWRHARRRHLRPQDVQRQHPRPRDDGGARRRPHDEGIGRCAARLGKRRGGSRPGEGTRRPGPPRDAGNRHRVRQGPGSRAGDHRPETRAG